MSIDRERRRNAELRANIAGPTKPSKPVFVAPPEPDRHRMCPRYPSPRGARYVCDADGTREAYGHGHLCSDLDGTYLVERIHGVFQTRRVER